MGQNATVYDWTALCARYDALDTAMRERANLLAHGLGDGRNVWHNAIIALANGRPWPEVDYSRLRAAIRLDARRREVSALRSRHWRARFGTDRHWSATSGATF